MQKLFMAFFPELVALYLWVTVTVMVTVTVTDTFVEHELTDLWAVPPDAVSKK